MLAVRSRILALEVAYRQALIEDKVDDILVAQCTEVFRLAAGALTAGEVDADTTVVLHRVASFIRIASGGLAESQRRCDALRLQTMAEARAIMRKSGQHEAAPLFDDDYHQADDSTTDDPTTFTPYRQWFLDHFANPYPSSMDKDLLLEQVTVHTRRQLDTWYTNQRRRSGWHALKRKYVHISTLLKRIDDADEDNEEMQQARQEVERVRAYFKNDRQDHVRDEIREIISQGPPTTATKRRIEAGTPRRVVGRTQRARIDFAPTFLDNPAPAPAPVMPGSWTPYSVAQNDDFFAPASPSRQQPTPRLPSDFSSPDSSRRTFSGSSSSSTNSLISYDSLDIPVSTTGPGSPPASSSLLNFDGRSTFVPSSPARTSRLPPHRGSFVVRNSVYPTRPHTNLCTVNELPTGSSLARFASS